MSLLFSIRVDLLKRSRARCLGIRALMTQIFAMTSPNTDHYLGHDMRQHHRPTLHSDNAPDKIPTIKDIILGHVTFFGMTFIISVRLMLSLINIIDSNERIDVDAEALCRVATFRMNVINKKSSIKILCKLKMETS